MTQEPRHHPSGPLGLAVVLAAVAGFVDAHVYLFVTPVFVANMSGNLVRLGLDAGLGRWRAASGSAVALMAFMAGVVVAVSHLDRQLRRRGHVSAAILLRVEAVLVLTLPVVRAAGGGGFGVLPRPVDYAVLVIAAFAMGLQAAALRRVGEIAVATTYGTGAVVRIGEKVALAARRAERAGDHRRSLTIAVLVVVLVSYVAGAAIAAVTGDHRGLLVVPGLVLAAVSAVPARSVGLDDHR